VRRAIAATNRHVSHAPESFFVGAESYVDWCGQAQGVIPFPRRDGRMVLVWSRSAGNV